MSFSEPWREIAEIVQRYIACDIRYDVVRPQNLMLLAALRQKVTINLPFFLNPLLHEIIDRIGKAKDTKLVVNHHCLIKLIVSRELNQA